MFPFLEKLNICMYILDLFMQYNYTVHASAQC